MHRHVRNDRIAIETESHLCIKALFFKRRRISKGSLTVPISNPLQQSNFTVLTYDSQIQNKKLLSFTTFLGFY